jgi:hypothetical protein
MRKTILLIAAALLVPCLIFAAEEGIAGDSQVYKDIKTLVDAKLITMPLDKDKLTRKEAASFADNAATGILASGGADRDQIELAFGLLQSFETDLMEQGQKLSDIQKKMIDLKVMEERLNMKALEEKQDKLFGSVGARINGETTAYMTDLLLYGGGMTGNDKRYKPITEYIDFDFSAHSGNLLTADAVLRLENLFGGFWGDQDFFGVRKVSISGNFPVYFTIGSYMAKLTPLTLWANDDDRPFEAKVFSDKRDMNKKELYLSDDAWPVTGGRTGYNGQVLGASLEAEGFAARLEGSGQNNYPVAPGYVTYTTDLFHYSYDQYMWGGRIASDFTLKDVLKVGGNFVEIKDIKDTGTTGAPALDNYVASADAELKLFGIVKASGEFAVSNYNVSNNISPQAWQNKYISDSALDVKAEADYMDTKLEAQFFVVGNSFTAYAAQGRIYDGKNNFDYLTQNNTWNVSQTIPTYVLAGSVYPFTRYNNLIVTSYAPTGHNTMPYIIYENSAAPDGPGTPNRQGLTARLSGSYLDAAVQPYLRYTYASEIVSYLPGFESTCPVEFKIMEGGIKAKVTGILLTGGYKYEYTSNGYTGGNVDYKSGIIDAGAEYKLLDKLTLSLGFKDIAFNGSEYDYTYNSSGLNYGSYYRADGDIMSCGCGVDLEVTKQASCGVSLTQTIITDKLDATKNYNAQEIDANVSLKF